MISVTWYGNAAFGITSDNAAVLFDPFLELDGGEHPNNKGDFGLYSQIFLTHGHVDHLGNLPQILDPEREYSIYCTDTPVRTLLRKGIREEFLHRIHPGDVVRLCHEAKTSETEEEGYLTVKVFQGKHIHFDARLLLTTFFSPRILKYGKNLRWFVKEHLRDHENGETVGFLITVQDGLRIFLMGSLGLDEKTEYPSHMDVLILPYQGASDLVTPAMQVIRRLQPLKIVLSHFDDAFPPLSRSIDPAPLIERMAQEFPAIEVIVPRGQVPLNFYKLTL